MGDAFLASIGKTLSRMFNAQLRSVPAAELEVAIEDLRAAAVSGSATVVKGSYQGQPILAIAILPGSLPLPK